MKSSITLLTFLFILNGCNRGDDKISYKCNLVPDSGLCKAAIPKYYFDRKESKCKEFIWGGCNGVVPFNTLAECEQCKCEQSPSE